MEMLVDPMESIRDPSVISSVDSLFLAARLDFTNEVIEFFHDGVKLVRRFFFRWKNDLHRIDEPVNIRLCERRAFHDLTIVFREDTVNRSNGIVLIAEMSPAPYGAG
ncbi:hypothetical protein HY411_00725, partial [Candidatus Gottesmanbacteria bacterium]|nr:hypothetical protein [Candidatus Gottesmanbacteria bacterium]